MFVRERPCVRYGREGRNGEKERIEKKRERMWIKTWERVNPVRR